MWRVICVPPASAVESLIPSPIISSRRGRRTGRCKLILFCEDASSTSSCSCRRILWHSLTSVETMPEAEVDAETEVEAEAAEPQQETILLRWLLSLHDPELLVACRIGFVIALDSDDDDDDELARAPLSISPVYVNVSVSVCTLRGL